MDRKPAYRYLTALLAVLLILSCVSPSLAAKALSKGSRGEEVRRLQQRLTELGFAPGAADGVFGNATYLAVMMFQSRNGLTMDGAAGIATLEVLYSENARGAIPQADEQKPYETADRLPLLVNGDHAFPEGYIYYDLVVMNDYCDKKTVKIKYANTLAEREAVDALIAMLTAAKAEGIGNWQISAACRTVSDQTRLLNSRINTNVKNGMSRKRAESAARQTVALPGYSEHHLGTCFDITVPGAVFQGTKQHKWLLEHCWDYGFILRYAKEKEKITGYLAEAWHYRYVGREHALAMKESGLCLEEYLETFTASE